jgi:NADPH-dependent glutamate synthase beta subunit-like oxidoreductase
MLNFGIPAYRLPRAELMAEIKRIEEFDVKIVLNSKVQDVLEAKAAGKFDAVFVAIGAHLAKHVDIPARDATKVFDAVALLRDVGTGGKRVLGRRVVIYGGGNTAMDAARTAKRLGVARTDGSRFHPATESVSEACIKFDDPAHVAADALGRVAGFAESGWPTNGAPLIQYPDQK